VESLGEDLENVPQHTRAHPLLKPPVARLIGGIPVREIGPWGAGPEDPQDAVEHRVPDLHVTEEQLNRPEVRATFQ
jgi:hypothetical protein